MNAAFTHAGLHIASLRSATCCPRRAAGTRLALPARCPAPPAPARACRRHAAAAAASGEAAPRGDADESLAVREPDGAAQAAAAAPPRRASPAALAAGVAAVVVTGVANRVLYKLALVPLGNHTFFLAQLQTFGYCVFYFVVLGSRRRAGLVPPAQLAFPRQMVGVFAAIGLVEALSALLSFMAAARLPGVVLPLLSQSVLVWQVALGYLVLRRRLGAVQLCGVAAVVGGVALAAWPAAPASSPLAGADPRYAAVFVLATVFPAVDTILKERVFRSARASLKQELDLFVVNSWGSVAQAGWVLALLPAAAAARGMALHQVPAYLQEGERAGRPRLACD
jgi:drug/metabolite transporter (DMT)-like permease